MSLQTFIAENVKLIDSERSRILEILALQAWLPSPAR